MHLSWKDLHQPDPQGEWTGLLLSVRQPAAPGLRVHFCARNRLSIATRSQSRLWVRIDHDYYGYELLRAADASSPGVLPPLPFELVRQHPTASEPRAFERAWARTFAALLRDSEASPLYPSDWQLSATESGSLTAAQVRQIVGQQLAGYVEWDFGDIIYPIALRRFSDADHGRIQAWRKHVRGNSLPPVLLYWVSGLRALVILDGHDRLLAAALESSPARGLVLQAVREQLVMEEEAQAVARVMANALAAAERSRALPASERLARPQRWSSVEDANRTILRVFAPKLQSAPTRAWPLAGGVPRWIGEVRRELTRQNICESALLVP